MHASIHFYNLASASVARRFCESSRHISRPCDLQPHQQRCVYTISNQNFISFITSSINVCFPNLTIYFSFLAAIHLFARSVTKSKISTLPAKKLVAVTGGVYASIQFYNLAIAFVTAGTVCPAAIYHARVIYNPANNAVFIKYLDQKPHTIFRPIFALYVFQNVTAHYIAPPIFVYVEYVLLPTTLCR